MKNVIMQTVERLSEIRLMVENGELPESKYGLNTFRYEPTTINQIIKELKECM